jgi:hypothetical protein
MRTSRTIVAVLLSMLLIVVPAGAQSSPGTVSQAPDQSPPRDQQTHIVDLAKLDDAVHQRVDQDQADRDLLVRVLRRSEVREIAGRLGVDMSRAETAVATLEGSELRAAAAQGRQVEQALAGGASTVVISTTTIIIALLAIILLVVLLK